MEISKTVISKTKYFLLAFFVSLAFSCDGEDGTNGIDGAQGPAGPAGQDGNANVVSVLLENQTVTTGSNTFTVPALTQDIYDAGLVYGYVTVNGNDFWETIPVITAGTTILDINRIRVGEIDIETNFGQSGLNFRFILVASNNSKLNLDPSKMTYEEAMDYFGLDY